MSERDKPVALAKAHGPHTGNTEIALHERDRKSIAAGQFVGKGLKIRDRTSRGIFRNRRGRSPARRSKSDRLNAEAGESPA
jgi:hypothetical protein